MRRRATLVSVFLALLAVAIIGVGVIESGIGTTRNAAAFEVVTLVPSTVGSAYTSIRWSGGDANTSVYLIAGSPHVAEFRFLCQAAPGQVARGFGATGSLLVTLTGGTTYSLYACTGSSSNPTYGIAITFSYSFLGLTYVILSGILIGVVAALSMTNWVRRGIAKLLSHLR